MKNLLKYISLSLSMSLLFVACQDEDTIRYELSDVERIVDMRITRSTASFDASKSDASTTLTVYSQTAEDVEQVELFVDHNVFLNDSTSERVSLRTIPGSEIDYEGSVQFDLSLTDITGALGITPDDLSGGDILTIYNITTLKNGMVYPDTILKGTDFETLNISPTVTQSSNTTSFTTTLQYPIVCELPDGFATGEYLVEVLEGSNSPFGGIFGDDVVVDVESTTNTGRTFSIPYLFAAVPGYTTDVDFELACNIVLVPETSGGLQCNVGLTWAINTANPGTFDITDDSEFTISFLHNTQADCGLPASDPFVLKLTKQ